MLKVKLVLPFALFVMCIGANDESRYSSPLTCAIIVFSKNVALVKIAQIGLFFVVNVLSYFKVKITNDSPVAKTIYGPPMAKIIYGSSMVKNTHGSGHTMARNIYGLPNVKTTIQQHFKS